MRGWGRICLGILGDDCGLDLVVWCGVENAVDVVRWVAARRGKQRLGLKPRRMGGREEVEGEVVYSLVLYPTLIR